MLVGAVALEVKERVFPVIVKAADQA